MVNRHSAVFVIVILLVGSLLATGLIIVFEYEVRRSYDFCVQSDQIPVLSFFSSSYGCYIDMTRLIEGFLIVLDQLCGPLLISYLCVSILRFFCTMERSRDKTTIWQERLGSRRSGLLTSRLLKGNYQVPSETARLTSLVLVLMMPISATSALVLGAIGDGHIQTAETILKNVMMQAFLLFPCCYLVLSIGYVANKIWLRR